MRNNLLRAVAGLEDNEEIVTGNEVVLPETVEEIAVQAAAEQVADVAGDVEEQGNDVQELADDVEDLEEKVEELAEQVAGAESFLKSGNWNREAFAITYGAAERLHQKLGGAALDVVGTESLGNATTAELAARAGLEAMGETVKKIGSQAIAFIKRIWDQIITFVKGLFDKATRLRTLAGKVTARLNAKDVKAKEQLKLGKWNAYIDVEKSGDAASASLLVAALKEAGNALTAADALVKDPKAHAPIHSALEGVGSALGKLGSAATNVKKSDKAGTIYVTGYIHGVAVSYSYFNGEVKGVEDVAKEARALRVSFKVGGNDVKTSGEIKNPITLERAKTLVKLAEQAIDSLKSSKVDAKFTTAQRDKTIGLLKAADGKEDAGKAISAVKSVYGAVAALTSGVSRQTLNLAEAYLQAARAAV